ncbi:carbohydrate kinase family protein, partial [Nitratireductor sp. ZSWI3]|uniref:carbohydrate kinase family protein n=1 Tax=Nitratireductor sp. ZSWI3 TaxID=2966359 RepID=UPI00214FB328
GRLAPSFKALSTLFMNSREARSLAGLGEDASPAMAIYRLQERGLGAGVITAGSSSVLVFSGGGLWEIAPPRVEPVVDVTGAGDALAGATIAALMRGSSLPEAAREGVAAAGLAVASASAAPEFDDTIFTAALARVPAPHALS